MLHVSLLHLKHELKILTAISQTSAQNSTQEDFIWARHEVKVDSEIDNVFNGVFHFRPLTIEDWQRSGLQVSRIFLSLSFITSLFGVGALSIQGTSSQTGFYVTILCLVLLVLFMHLYFKKRRQV